MSLSLLGGLGLQRKREMGKYIRKAKTRGELAVMEVSQSSLGLGVRTRARTLALQKSQHAPPSPTNSASSYLQLRSRRLHKPEERVVVKRQKHATKDDDSNHNNKQLENPSAVSKDEVKEVVADQEVKKNTDVGVEEASFGENVLELEGRERWVFLAFLLFFFFLILVCLLRKRGKF